ncbi:MAG TPA: hypothetical protein VN642_03875 [Dongiaceae bacterium]|nr:hypothetical protein [Dongiaceae bacterium]
MNSITLIEEYFKDHAGISSFIDVELRRVHESVKDAEHCLARGEKDYAVANMVFARHLIDNLTMILILYPSHIWDELVVLFHAVDNELNSLKGN